MVKYNLIFLALFLLSKINAQKKAESEEKKLNKPEPKLVVQGKFSSAPIDAVVLFDGKDFSRWQHSKTNSLSNGY